MNVDKSRTTIEIYLRTTVLVISWITMGICGEIVGPTMSILSHNIRVTFNGMATVLGCGSIGGLLTNILCGISQEFLTKHRDLIIMLIFVLRALLACATPFINSLILLCLVFFSNGICGSIANMEGTDLLFKMWQDRVATPLNIVHFGYGFGAIIANLIVRPFFNVKTHPNETISRSVSMPLDADIRIPYFIAAGSCSIVASMHLTFYIWEQIKKNKQNKLDYLSVKTTDCKMKEKPKDKNECSEYSPAVCGHGYFSYGLSLSTVFILYMFLAVGIDQTVAKFYFSFLKFEKFNISTDSASWGIILFWFFFSIGRLIGAIESIFLPVTISLIIQWCGGLLLALVWIVYVWILELTPTSLFVLGSLTGFVVGPLFALSFAWIKHQLNVIPLLLGIILCGCGLGSAGMQKIAGLVMDRNPNNFPILLTVGVLACMLLFILLNVIVFFHQRKLKAKQNQISTVTNEINEEEQKMADYLQNVNETL